MIDRARRVARHANSHINIWNRGLGYFVIIIALISGVLSLLGKSDSSDAITKVQQQAREAKVIATQQAAINVRQTNEEACIKSILSAQRERTTVLVKIAAKRDHWADVKDYWQEAEQQVFKHALSGHSKQADVRRDFKRANLGYLHAANKYRQYKKLYTQSSLAHPIPKDQCNAGKLNQAPPVITKIKTHTITKSVPGPTHTLPGKTTTVHVPGPTTTVTVRPGKHRGR